MTLLYRGPGARITHEVFEAQAPCHQTYSIDELKYVHAVKATIVDATVGSKPMTVCSTAAAGLSAALVATGTSIFDSPFATVLALLVLAVASILSLQSWRVRSRPHTLWAIYRGQLVCLFSTRDRLVFGQVSRALLRALERIDDTR